MDSYIVKNNLYRATNVSPIIFTKEDATVLHYTYCDALVMRTMIAHDELNAY